MIERFRNHLLASGLFPEPGLVLVAVSGGHDSVALLRLLHAGVDRKTAVGTFGQLFAGDVNRFLRTSARVAKKIRGWPRESLAALVLNDLKGTLVLETALLLHQEVMAPDTLGAVRRLEALRSRGKKAKLTKDLRVLEKAVRSLKSEAVAQEALFAITVSGSVVHERARLAFLKRHGKTRVGHFAAAQLWK